MNLTKKRWDKVQTIQNDLLLWQPRFLLNVEKTSREQQQEGPSLLSIVAVMTQGLWYLQPSDDHLYTLDFSEFKYFACMKHLGRDENITTLDIEQLALNDAIKQRPLICRTLPKIMAVSFFIFIDTTLLISSLSLSLYMRSLVRISQWYPSFLDFCYFQI